MVVTVGEEGTGSGSSGDGGEGCEGREVIEVILGRRWEGGWKEVER